MKKGFYSYLVVSLFVLQFGMILESEAQIKEERNVSPAFTGIEVTGGINLIVGQGAETRIWVETDEEHLDEVKTEVVKGVLKLSMDHGIFEWFSSRTVTVSVTHPDIQYLSASGGADIEGKGVIDSEEIQISSSGGADVELEIKAVRTKLGSSGGADIHVKGETDELEVSASGGSDVKAKDLKARCVIASSSGGADIEVYASEKIKASASGGSDIDYFGPASQVEENESGGGDVTHR